MRNVNKFMTVNLYWKMKVKEIVLEIKFAKKFYDNDKNAITLECFHKYRHQLSF